VAEFRLRLLPVATRRELRESEVTLSTKSTSTRVSAHPGSGGQRRVLCLEASTRGARKMFREADVDALPSSSSSSSFCF